MVARVPDTRAATQCREQTVEVVYPMYDGHMAVGDGSFRTVRKGEHYPADDPVVLANPGAFSPDPRYGVQWTGTPPAELADPPVEQATAGPGERRNVRRGTPRG